MYTLIELMFIVDDALRMKIKDCMHFEHSLIIIILLFYIFAHHITNTFC